MILIILCILALSLNDHVTATSRVDDLVARFLVDATPLLFPPSRISLQTCIDHGKIFILVIQYNCVNIAAKGASRNFRYCRRPMMRYCHDAIFGFHFFYHEIKSTSWIGIKSNFFSQMIRLNYPRYCRVIICCTVFIMFTWNSIQGFTTIWNIKIYTCWT